MESVATVLTSSNLIPLAVSIGALLVLLAVLAKVGFFSFKGFGLKVGKTESEVRALIIKQKEFVLEYCSSRVQTVLSDLNKDSENSLSYINVSYVFEQMVDVVLGWLLVNNIRDDKNYIESKVLEANLTVTKAVGKINNKLLQDEEVKNYLEKICREFTVEIITELLKIKKLEGF